MSKPFDELTEAEKQALRERDWSAAEIKAAISGALEAHDMEAAAGLLGMLALKDPLAAEIIMLTLALARESE